MNLTLEMISDEEGRSGQAAAWPGMEEEGCWDDDDDAEGLRLERSSGWFPPCAVFSFHPSERSRRLIKGAVMRAV